MATVTIKVNGYSSGYQNDETNISFDLNASNIADLEKAVKAYREETRLPETKYTSEQIKDAAKREIDPWKVDGKWTDQDWAYYGFVCAVCENLSKPAES